MYKLQYRLITSEQYAILWYSVVDCLIYPVILRIDFLQQNELMLDFTYIPVSIKRNDRELQRVDQVKVLWCSAQDAKGKQYAAAIMEDPNADMMEECIFQSMTIYHSLMCHSAVIKR